MVSTTSPGLRAKTPCRPRGQFSQLCSLTFFCLCLSLVSASSVAFAQSQPQANQQSQDGHGADAVASPGTISSQIADKSEAAIVGAHVTLKLDDQPATQEAVADNNGQFTFTDIPPGPFQLTISSPGFTTQTFSGVLHAGEVDVLPMIQLPLATAVTEVHVAAPTEELAEVQIQEQEKQRVLGVFPNFYVSYDPNAVALRPKQKFELAWKSTIDPVTFVLIGAVAGIQQSQNTFGGYGQGAQGYAKRYGAGFADYVTGTFIGGAILPSLLKQDPRYFYKGTGSKTSRALYAISMAVICKGDNGHWQFNYSAILGSLISGGLSNSYYPQHDRGAALTFENTAMGIGTAAAANLFQEFIVKKITPNLPKHDPANQNSSTP
ncbi:MAG: carboxypeptidase-like regulatory domain-containing protein [Candidatus Acidiferrales bacterium]